MEEREVSVDITGLFEPGGTADKIKLILAEEKDPRRCILALMANAWVVATSHDIPLEEVSANLFALDEDVMVIVGGVMVVEDAPSEPESNVVRLFPER